MFVLKQWTNREFNKTIACVQYLETSAWNPSLYIFIEMGTILEIVTQHKISMRHVYVETNLTTDVF